MNYEIIAVSGKSGCGNTSVCNGIAKQLGFEMLNYTFRNLAEERGVSLSQIAKEAELDTKWDELVDNKQKELALSASRTISGSRLSVWNIPQALLKVYLWAPLEVRSARIANREGLSAQQALTQTETRDKRDAARYKRLYNIDIDEPLPACDLVLNTTALSVESVVSIVCESYKAKLQVVSQA